MLSSTHHPNKPESNDAQSAIFQECWVSAELNPYHRSATMFQFKILNLCSWICSLLPLINNRTIKMLLIKLQPYAGLMGQFWVTSQRSSR